MAGVCVWGERGWGERDVTEGWHGELEERRGSCVEVGAENAIVEERRGSCVEVGAENAIVVGNGESVSTRACSRH